METFIPFIKIAVYLMMAIILLGSIAVVTMRNLFHSALFLTLVLILTAGLYITLSAEFLAAVQILLYVGAVMTLIIFVIMLTERLGEKTIPQKNKQSPFVIVGLLIFIPLVARIILKTSWPVKDNLPEVSVFDIGNALMGPYVFPFEVISVILIAALIGATIIARKEKS